MKGTVKWFNTQKGYGFIVGDDGTDYFVHYSNIKVSEFRHLDAGDHVEFDVETNDKGIQAINVVPVLTMSMIKERAARHNMHLEEAVGSELKESLASGTLSEEEAYNAKSQLLDIQNQLTDSYGSQA